MREVIKSWIDSKKPLVYLENKVVGTQMFYEYHAFMGRNEKFYSCAYVYNSYRIVPFGNPEDVLSLMSGDGQVNVNSDDQYSIIPILEYGLREFDSREDWIRNRNKRVSQTDLEKFLAKYYAAVIKDCLTVRVDSFSVLDISAGDFLLTVSYTKNGIPQLPIRVCIGEPSFISRRYSGQDREFFTRFVEDLCSFTGGVVWNDSIRRGPESGGYLLG